MKSARTLSLALALTLPAAFPTSSMAQVDGPPSRIDYQGQVLDSSGNPLAPGAPTNYNMLFRLFDAQTSGNLIWSETQTVTVSKGAFSVRLGEGIRVSGDTLQTTDLTNAFRGRDRFLGLTVVIPSQTPAEITPRLAFLTSPFSFIAQKAQEADSMTILDAGGNNRVGAAKWSDLFTMSTSSQTDRADPTKWKLKEQNVPAGVSVPVGGVIMWWGAFTSMPAGFEICNGGAPGTPGALISTKPDLRDKFVKGAVGISGNVATSNITGGTNAIAATITGGTALSQGQLPQINVVSGDLTALTAGAHSHRVYEGPNDGGDSDGGDNGGAATGDSFDRNIPTVTTTTDGAHTHAVTGAINRSGSGQTHAHTIPAQDNRPAFLEMFYIIRVK